MEDLDLAKIENLSQRTQAFYQKYLREAPADLQTLKAVATARLMESGVQDKAITTGESIPAFTLLDAVSEELVSSQDLLSRGPMVISFFRGSWCGYCNIELEALTKISVHVRNLGANILAISPQMDGGIKDLVELFDVDFPILVDQGNIVAESFGLALEMDATLHDAYTNKLCINVPEMNKTDNWVLPITATYVVNQQGKVVDCETTPDHTIRMEPRRILETLRCIKGTP